MLAEKSLVCAKSRTLKKQTLPQTGRHVPSLSGEGAKALGAHVWTEMMIPDLGVSQAGERQGFVKGTVAGRASRVTPPPHTFEDKRMGLCG